MTVLHALLLGILQGLTEFVPVSSTAHLYLAQAAVGIRNDEIALAFDVTLHLGTALALVTALAADFLALARELVLWLARRPARRPEARALLLPLAVGTVPGVLAGLFLLKRFESIRSLALIGLSMLIASAYFVFSERVAATWAGRQRLLAEVRLSDALWIGVAQAAAGLMAGFSRSGFTIATGLNRGLRREESARFSFLLGLPLIAGAGAKALLDLRHEQGPSVSTAALVTGFLSAAVVGFLAVRFLLRYLKTHSLRPFAIYLGVLGVVLFGVSFSLRLPLIGEPQRVGMRLSAVNWACKAHGIEIWEEDSWVVVERVALASGGDWPDGLGCVSHGRLDTERGSRSLRGVPLENQDPERPRCGFDSVEAAGHNSALSHRASPP